MLQQSEVDKFNDLSQFWWDPTGPLKTLHHINTVRLQFIEQHVQLKSKTILDVGCGGGLLSETLAQKGAIVTGLDPAVDSIETAKRHAHEHNVQNITYQASTIEALANDQVFDVITCMELLEHVPEPEVFLKKTVQHLKPGGYLFLSTLNRNLKSYLFSIVAAEYLLKLLPKGTHDYQKFIRPSELNRVLEQENLQCVDMKGIAYHPLLASAKLNRSLDVNYIAVYSTT